MKGLRYYPKVKWVQPLRYLKEFLGSNIFQIVKTESMDNTFGRRLVLGEYFNTTSTVLSTVRVRVRVTPRTD